MKKYPKTGISFSFLIHSPFIILLEQPNATTPTDENKPASETEPIKKPEGPVYIENGAFVPLPKNKDGSFRPLPKAVKTRETNLIEKLKEIKIAAHIEAPEVRGLLNELLVAIVNNNR